MKTPKFNAKNIIGSTRHSFGYSAEREIVRAYQKMGLLAIQDKFAGHDVRLINLKTGNCVKIEVKVSKLAKDNRYHATLVKTGKYGSTNAYKSDYIIFLTIDKKSVNAYIIPTKEISSRQITIPNNPDYAGKWAKYRSLWFEV